MPGDRHTLPSTAPLKPQSEMQSPGQGLRATKMLRKYLPQVQQMWIVETNIPSSGKHTQEWEEEVEKLWASDEQQISQAKPEPGFTFQNRRNRDL